MVEVLAGVCLRAGVSAFESGFHRSRRDKVQRQFFRDDARDGTFASDVYVLGRDRVVFFSPRW